MDVIGRITTVLFVLTVVAGVAIGVKSIPDVKRYLNMRRM